MLIKPYLLYFKHSMPKEVSSMWISVRMLCDFDRLMMDFMVLGVLGGGVDDFHSSEDIFEAVGGILTERFTLRVV